MIGWLMVALVAGSPVPAAFHNRPGATLAELRAETTRCRTIATGTDGQAVDGRALTPPLGPAATEPVRATIAGCLMLRGWRTYALSSRDRAALARMAPAERARALERLTGARRPMMGRLVHEAGGLLRPPQRAEGNDSRGGGHQSPNRSAASKP